MTDEQVLLRNELFRAVDVYLDKADGTVSTQRISVVLSTIANLQGVMLHMLTTGDSIELSRMLPRLEREIARGFRAMATTAPSYRRTDQGVGQGSGLEGGL